VAPPSERSQTANRGRHTAVVLGRVDGFSGH